MDPCGPSPWRFTCWYIHIYGLLELYITTGICITTSDLQIYFASSESGLKHVSRHFPIPINNIYFHVVRAPPVLNFRMELRDAAAGCVNENVLAVRIKSDKGVIAWTYPERMSDDDWSCVAVGMLGVTRVKEVKSFLSRTRMYQMIRPVCCYSE